MGVFLGLQLADVVTTLIFMSMELRKAIRSRAT